jgi:hypothetical protein
MKTLFGVALASALSVAAMLVVAPVPAEAQSCTKQRFCTGWNVHCNRGGTADECQRRFRACLSSGCFFYSSPRSRCVTNAQDVAMTKTCRG